MTERRNATTSMRTAGSILAVSLTVSLIPAGSASARPAYKSEFEKLYPQFKEAGNKVTCGVCHPGKSKKDRNHYGEALAKALKEPDIKDKKTITEALKEIEDGHCPDPPKTKWKTLLEKGVPPCTHKKAANQRLQPTLSLIQRLLEER